MPLPKLPSVPAKVRPNPNFVLVYMEPIPPKFSSANIKLTPEVKARLEQEEHDERRRKVLQLGSLRRAIIIRLPNGVDKAKFQFEEGDVVGVPLGQYDTMNIDRTPLHLVGLYDLSVLPDLTDEDVELWEKKQAQYINEVVYPNNELDNPGRLVGMDGANKF